MKYPVRILLILSILRADIWIASAQSDSRHFSILIMDQQRHLALPGATVKIDERTWIADSTGRATVFRNSLKPFHARIECAGYVALEMHLYPQNGQLKDTVYLLPSATALQSVTVQGYRLTKSYNEIAPAASLNEKELDKSKGGSLATILTAIPGLNILQTGSTIGKPVVDGLYGNRVLVINNGVKLEGQAWGVEHAPEIDPSIASSITVIKGADAVRYGAEALGGVILLDPPPLPFGDPALHGEVNVNGVANGRGGSGSLWVGSSFKQIPQLAWRLQGSYKRLGNFKAPDYYLENTGLEEKNFSAALGYKIKRGAGQVFFSQYQTALGIFIGSDIGSAADLYTRIHGTGPFDSGVFSYDYKAPYQRVTHRLLKTNLAYDLRDGSHLEIKYNLQKDFRKEFDKRRSTRATIPITDLVLTTNTLEGSWQKVYNGKWHMTAGIHLRAQSNYNDTVTLSNPVIPNYSANSIGGYGIGRLILNDRLQLEAGLRGDYQSFNAAGRRYLYQYYDENGNVVPNKDVPYYEGKLTLRGGYRDYGGDRTFQNISFITGARWKVDEQWQLRSNLGLAWRSPNAEELYSYGLHQSVSAIEYGDSTLESEHGYKWITTVEKNGPHFSFNANVYFQYIQHYIYLNPSGTFEQTVTGAYPVFSYLQTNAFLKGLDLQAAYRFGHGGKMFEYQLKAAVVRAYDLSEDRFLPFIPADRLTNSLQWNLPDAGHWVDNYLQGSYQYVARQNRYEPGSDFLKPPDAYGLFGITAGTKWLIGTGDKSLALDISVQNLLNTSYRDYMNRFRYYADDIGRNIQLHATFRF